MWRLSDSFLEFLPSGSRQWLVAVLVMFLCGFPPIFISESLMNTTADLEYGGTDFWQTEVGVGDLLGSVGRSYKDSADQPLMSRGVSLLDYSPEARRGVEYKTACNQNLHRRHQRRVLLSLLPILFLAFFGVRHLYKKSRGDLQEGQKALSQKAACRQEHEDGQQSDKRMRRGSTGDEEQVSSFTLRPRMSSGASSIADVKKETFQETMNRLRALDGVEEEADRLAQVLEASHVKQSTKSLRETLQSARQILRSGRKISPLLQKKIHQSTVLAMGAIEEMHRSAQREALKAHTAFKSILSEDNWGPVVVWEVDMMISGKFNEAYIPFFEAQTDAIALVQAFEDKIYTGIVQSDISDESKAKVELERVAKGLKIIGESAAVVSHPMKARASLTSFALDLKGVAFKRLHKVGHKLLEHMYQAQMFCLEKCLSAPEGTLEPSVIETARSLENLVKNCGHMLKQHVSALDAICRGVELERLVGAEHEAESVAQSLRIALRSSMTRMEIVPDMQGFLVDYAAENLGAHAKEMKLSVEATMARLQQVVASVKSELENRSSESRKINPEVYSMMLRSVNGLTEAAKKVMAESHESYSSAVERSKSSSSSSSTGNNSGNLQDSAQIMSEQLEKFMMDAHKLCVQAEKIWLRTRLLLSLEADVQQCEEYVSRVIAAAAREPEVADISATLKESLAKIKEATDLTTVADAAASLRNLATKSFFVGTRRYVKAETIHK